MRTFPISIELSDNSFNEINSSWYKFKYSRKYFADYNYFYKFIFNSKNIPLFIRFAQGLIILFLKIIYF